MSFGDFDKKPPLKRRSKMDFGKHAGETIDDVIDSDPQYLEWACDNVTGFAERLEDGLEEDIRDAAEDKKRDFPHGRGSLLPGAHEW